MASVSEIFHAWWPCRLSPQVVACWKFSTAARVLCHFFSVFMAVSNYCGSSLRARTPEALTSALSSSLWVVLNSSITRLYSKEQEGTFKSIKPKPVILQMRELTHLQPLMKWKAFQASFHQPLINFFDQGKFVSLHSIQDMTCLLWSLRKDQSKCLKPL